MGYFKFKLANGQRPDAETGRKPTKPMAKQLRKELRRAEHSVGQDDGMENGGTAGTGGDRDDATGIAFEHAILEAGPLIIRCAQGYPRFELKQGSLTMGN